MAKPYSRQLAAQVGKYIRSQGWNVNFDHERGLYRLTFKSVNRLPEISLIVRIFEDRVVSRGYPGIKADIGSYTRVVEYVTRANYEFYWHGLFDFDYSDGEIAFERSHDCTDGTPSLILLEKVVDHPIVAWNRFGDGLLAMMHSDSSPADEIRKACE